jgi:hypothetical protein
LLAPFVAHGRPETSQFQSSLSDMASVADISTTWWQHLQAIDANMDSSSFCMEPYPIFAVPPPHAMMNGISMCDNKKGAHSSTTHALSNSYCTSDLMFGSTASVSPTCAMDFEQEIFDHDDDHDDACYASNALPSELDDMSYHFSHREKSSDRWQEQGLFYPCQPLYSQCMILPSSNSASVFHANHHDVPNLTNLLTSSSSQWFVTQQSR